MSWRDTSLWTWHVIAGLVILILLGLHMGVMHLSAVLHLSGLNPADVDNPLDWRNVAFRAKQVFFMISYVVLLGAGLFHGLYGLRNILLELGPGPGARRAIGSLLLAVGVVLFVIGTWAAVVARTTALAG
jgi:succinate dehydrogenase hydrophobic anchor subunit